MSKYVLFVFILICTATYSQKVEKIEMSPCDRNSTPEYMYRNRLIDKKMVGDTLFLNLGMVRQCSFEPIVSNCKKEQDTLFLTIEEQSELWSPCECCYELNLSILDVVDTNFILKINNVVVKRKNKYFIPLLKEIELIENENMQDSTKQNVKIWSTYYDDSNVLKTKRVFFMDESGDPYKKCFLLYDASGEVEGIEVEFVSDKDNSYTYSLSKEEYRKINIE